MPSIILSTIAFFVASVCLKRYLDEMDIPKGMTRSAMVFTIALAISYVVGLAVDHLHI